MMSPPAYRAAVLFLMSFAVCLIHSPAHQSKTCFAASAIDTPRETNQEIRSKDDSVKGMSPDAPPETKQLAFKVGTWKIEAKIRRAKDVYVNGTGTMKVYFDTDGKTLLADMNVKFPRFVVKGTTKRVYHAPSKEWRVSWHPANGPVTQIEGRMKDNRFIEINYGNDPQGPFLGRLVIYNLSNDRFSVRKDRLYDNGVLKPEIWAYEATRIK